MQLSQIRAEIEHMRRQIARQRKEMLALQQASISTKPAEELLARMLAKVDELCAVDKHRVVPTTQRRSRIMNRNPIGTIRELTGEELDCETLDLVSGGGGAAVLGSLTGGVVSGKSATR